jgi:hypothetical protein
VIRTTDANGSDICGRVCELALFNGRSECAMKVVYKRSDSMGRQDLATHLRVPEVSAKIVALLAKL